MNAAAQRVFEAKPAQREAVGLLVGLVGPSSSGKTFSALRIATGIQSVVGGEIDVIDTENGRALYYADKFKFNHIRFGAPFSPLDYLEAIRFSARRGAKTILVDSMSHEHEGPGGVLEWHQTETERLAKLWKVPEAKAQLAAWAAPKAARRRLINEILQLNVNLVLTFRAKEKIKVVKGKDPVELGWQPICGDEFMYEMVLQCLLKPGSNGVPSWDSAHDAERAVMKKPLQFAEMFTDRSRQLDETLGIALAKWAVGGSHEAPELDDLIGQYARCDSETALKALEQTRRALWGKPMPPGYKARIKEAADAAHDRMKGPQDASATHTPEEWSDTLSGQTTLKGLESAWEACCTQFNGEAPTDCEAAYTFRKEALEEAGAELDL
jgi:hypothetical protein